MVYLKLRYSESTSYGLISRGNSIWISMFPPIPLSHKPDLQKIYRFYDIFSCCCKAKSSIIANEADLATIYSAGPVFWSVFPLKYIKNGSGEILGPLQRTRLLCTLRGKRTCTYSGPIVKLSHSKKLL